MGLTAWATHAAGKPSGGWGVKSNAKEFRLYPEGSAEALQGFKQRCGVMRFTTETSLRL